MSDKSKTIEWGASLESYEEELPSVYFTFEKESLGIATSVSVFSPEFGDIPFMAKVELVKKWVIDMEEMHNENEGVH